MSSSVHDHPDLGPPQLIELADRVFAYWQPDGSCFADFTIWHGSYTGRWLGTGLGGGTHP